MRPGYFCPDCRLEWADIVHPCRGYRDTPITRRPRTRSGKALALHLSALNYPPHGYPSWEDFVAAVEEDAARDDA